MFRVMISFFLKDKELTLFLARHYYFTNFEKKNSYISNQTVAKSAELEQFW